MTNIQIIKDLTVLYDNLLRETKEDTISFDLLQLSDTQDLLNKFRELKFKDDSCTIDTLDTWVTELFVRYIEGSSLPLSQLSDTILKSIQTNNLDIEKNKEDEDLVNVKIEQVNNQEVNEYLYSHLTKSHISSFITSIANRICFGDRVETSVNDNEDETQSSNWRWVCIDDKRLPIEKKRVILAVRKVRDSRRFTIQKLSIYLQKLNEGNNEKAITKAEESYIKANQKRISANQNYKDVLNKIQEEEKKREQKQLKQQEKLEKKQQQLLQKKLEEEKKQELAKAEEKETKPVKTLLSFFSSSSDQNHMNSENVQGNSSTLKQAEIQSLSTEEIQAKEDQYKSQLNDSVNIPELMMKNRQIFLDLKSKFQKERKSLYITMKSQYKEYLNQKDKENKVLENTNTSNSLSEVQVLSNTKIIPNSTISIRRLLRHKAFQYNDSTFYFHLYSFYSYQLRQFYEDNRPPFLGFQKKISLLVSGRHPFEQEKDKNYETDSGVEWYGDIESESFDDEDDEDDEEENEGEQPINQFDYNDNFLVEDEVEGEGMKAMTSEEKSKYVLKQISGRREEIDHPFQAKNPILINRMNPDCIIILSSKSNQEEGKEIDIDIDMDSSMDSSMDPSYKYIQDSSLSSPSLFPSDHINNSDEFLLCSYYPLYTKEELYALHRSYESNKTIDSNLSNAKFSPSKQRVEINEEMIHYMILLTHNQSTPRSNIIEQVYTKYPQLKKIQIKVKLNELIDSKEKNVTLKKQVWKVHSTLLQHYNIPEDYIYDIKSIYNSEAKPISDTVINSSMTTPKENNKNNEIERIKNMISSTMSFTNGFMFSADSSSQFEEPSLHTNEVHETNKNIDQDHKPSIESNLQFTLDQQQQNKSIDLQSHPINENQDNSEDVSLNTLFVKSHSINENQDNSEDVSLNTLLVKSQDPNQQENEHQNKRSSFSNDELKTKKQKLDEHSSSNSVKKSSLLDFWK